MIPGTVLLSGIVGSTAYGLARPGSDIDVHGMYVLPTTDLLGLTRPAEAYRTTSPDMTYHEAGKLVRLLLASNPAATELLWLHPDLYLDLHPLAAELIAIRVSLLSAGCVEDSYLKYAIDQHRRLLRRAGRDEPGDGPKIAKQARHLWRLIQQGTDLNGTGRLTVRLDTEQARQCREFGERVASGEVDHARALIASAEAHFDEYGGSRSALPAEPDTAAAEAWLLKVRREFCALESAA